MTLPSAQPETGSVSPETTPSAFPSRLTSARSAGLADLETLVFPSREQGLKFAEFLVQAKASPHLHARNSAGFIVDALRSQGTDFEYHYGRMVEVFHAMRPDSDYPRFKIPRDHEETIYNLYVTLKELAKLPIPDKGIMLYGAPGSGKNLIIDLLLHVVEDYSRYHEQGARFELGIAVNLKDLDFGFGPSRISTHNNNGQVDLQQKDQVIYTSGSHTTPFSLLNFEIEHARHCGNRALHAQLLDQRDALLDELATRQEDRPLNREYILQSHIGPTLKGICQILIAHYQREQELSLPDAFATLRKDNAVAFPYFFDSELGEGLLSKIPIGNTGSDAWGLHSLYSGKSEVPKALGSTARDPLIVGSAQLRVDVTHIEDMFHPRMDLGDLTYLHELIEYGRMQIPAIDPESLARVPTRLLTISGKDSQFVASANTQNIHNRSSEEGFSPLAERFVGLNVPHIRNYREQEEALKQALPLLPGDRKATPHAVEVAALFFTATRLLDPRQSYYMGDYKEAAEIVSRLSGGLSKALYLALKPGEGQEQILNLITQQTDGTKVKEKFTGPELKYLMRPEVHNRIAHEHISTGHIGAISSLTDGGFGISPRVVKEIFGQMLNYRGHTDLTMRDVVDFLKTQEGKFPYYSALREARNKIQQQIYADECQHLNINPIDPASFDSAAISNEQRAQAKRAWQNAALTTDQRFPIVDPVKMIAELELFAKALMRRDILNSLELGLEHSQSRLAQYMAHAIAYVVPSREVPAEYRVVSKAFSDRGNNTRGIDERVLRNVEEDLDIAESQKDDFRKDMVNAFNGVTIDINKRHEEQHLPPATFAQMLEFAFVHKEIISSRLKLLNDKAASESKDKLLLLLDGMSWYVNQPETLRAHLADANRKNKAEIWNDAWENLKKAGYTERVLPGLIQWAIDRDQLEPGSDRARHQ